MNRPKYIILRLLLVMLPVLMALAPARAQTGVVFAGQTSTLSVTEVPGETYSWELYLDDVSINFGTVPGNCPVTNAFINGSNTGVSVSVTWLVPGLYYFKLTAINANGCVNIRMGIMTVLQPLPTAVLTLDPNEVCVGGTANLEVKFTGTGPWSFKLEADDGINPPVVTTYSSISDNPFIIPVNPLVNTTYRVTELTDANGTNPVPSGKVTLTINQIPINSKIYLASP